MASILFYDILMDQAPVDTAIVLWPMSMPPYDFWLRGPVEMGRWFLGQGIGCRGPRLVPTAANGCAAFGSYRPDGQGGHQPFAIQVIEVSGERIVGHHNFVDTDLFAIFGLPARLQP